MHLVKIYKKKQKKNCETKAAFGHSCSNVHFSSFSTPLLYKCQGDMSRRLFLPPQTHQFLLVFYSHPLHFYYYVVNCFPPGGAQECGPIGCWHCSCNGTYYGKYYTCLILSKQSFPTTLHQTIKMTGWMAIVFHLIPCCRYVQFSETESRWHWVYKLISFDIYFKV